jgi:hypothetical protein
LEVWSDESIDSAWVWLGFNGKANGEVGRRLIWLKKAQNDGIFG